MLIFVEGGKPENPKKNPQRKDKNQQQTQPTYDAVQISNPGHTGGRQALSPLRHPCSPDYKTNKKNIFHVFSITVVLKLHSHL